MWPRVATRLVWVLCGIAAAAMGAPLHSTTARFAVFEVRASLVPRPAQLPTEHGRAGRTSASSSHRVATYGQASITLWSQ
jgi:hypothetical protein